LKRRQCEAGKLGLSCGTDGWDRNCSAPSIDFVTVGEIEYQLCAEHYDRWQLMEKRLLDAFNYTNEQARKRDAKRRRTPARD
jgi:hypothetical protein